RSPGSGSRKSISCWRCRSLEREVESAAAAGGGIDPDPAAVHLDDLLDDGQAYAGAAAELVAIVQALEQAEHALAIFLVDADAVVAHVERRRRAGLVAADLDRGPGLVVVLDRVGDEIAEQLGDAHAIAAQPRQPVHAQLDALLLQAELE